MSKSNLTTPITTLGLIAMWIPEIPAFYVGMTDTLPAWCRIALLIDAVIATFFVITVASRAGSKTRKDQV